MSPAEFALDRDLDRIAEEMSPATASPGLSIDRTGGEGDEQEGNVFSGSFKEKLLKRSGSADGLRAAAWAAACVASLKSGKEPTPHAQRYLRNSLVGKL